MHRAPQALPTLILCSFKARTQGPPENPRTPQLPADNWEPAHPRGWPPVAPGAPGFGSWEHCHPQEVLQAHRHCARSCQGRTPGEFLSEGGREGPAQPSRCLATCALVPGRVWQCCLMWGFIPSQVSPQAFRISGLTAPQAPTPPALAGTALGGDSPPLLF